MRGAPRRVKLEDYKEVNERARADADEAKQGEFRISTQGKENAEVIPTSLSTSSSRPLAEVVPIPQPRLSAYGRQVIPVPSRTAARMMKVDTIAEVPDGQHSLSMCCTVINFDDQIA